MLHNLNIRNPIWKISRKSKAPSKVKIFCWRILHGIISIKSILAGCHISTNDKCLICLVDVEDMSHLLFKCTRAKELWNALGLTEIIADALGQGRSGTKALEFLLLLTPRVLPNTNLQGMQETIIFTGWYLWWIRRQLPHGESVPASTCCAMSIRAIYGGQ
jgi:hypothetical protein